MCNVLGQQCLQPTEFRTTMSLCVQARRCPLPATAFGHLSARHVHAEPEQEARAKEQIGPLVAFTVRLVRVDTVILLFFDLDILNKKKQSNKRHPVCAWMSNWSVSSYRTEDGYHPLETECNKTDPNGIPLKIQQ